MTLFKKTTLFSLLILLLTGCHSYEKVAYLQQSGTQANLNTSEPAPIPDALIKVGDLLMITVNSTTPEAAMAFNLPLIPGGQNNRTYSGGSGDIVYGLGMQNYLVDTEGNLIFPIIGKMKVVGMTKNELVEKIKHEIYPRYITEAPIILVRYANFRVSVLGEVKSAGSYPIDNEKVSILDAIARAGDLTIYGRRDNILLIRENEGERTTVRLDLRDKNLVHSPYYYLQQNDVIYVDPNKSKARSSSISTAESLSISIVGTLISLSALIVNILR